MGVALVHPMRGGWGDQLLAAFLRRRLTIRMAAAPAPNSAAVAGSGTAVPPEELPPVDDEEEVDDVELTGSLGASFIAWTGVASDAASIARAKEPETRFVFTMSAPPQRFAPRRSSGGFRGKANLKQGLARGAYRECCEMKQIGECAVNSASEAQHHS